MFGMPSMLAMHSDDVRTFVAVIEFGSISAAARELHLTQPAVSRRVQRLENAIGTPLINRRTRPFALTDAGRAALERCRRVVSATDELATFAKKPLFAMRELRIGVAHALTELAVMDPIDRVRRDFPMSNVRLHTGWSGELLARVKSGSLDAAIVLLFDRESPPAGVEAQQLAREHLAVVVPRHWPSRRCRAQDLQQVEWILNPDGCAARAELRRAFARLELPLRVSVETYDYELQLRLIARGRGAGLVPSRVLLRSATRSKLRVLRVIDLEFPMGIWMVGGELSAGVERPLETFRQALIRRLSARKRA
jgi:DNA-binding transcriptional LysR family regulator